MENKEFIVGTLKEDGKVIAVAVYDRVKKKGKLERVEDTIERFKAGANIIGLLHKKQSIYRSKIEDFDVVDYPILDNNKYDVRLLPELNGKQEVVKAGAEVFIGNENEKYRVVDSQFKERLLSKEEIEQGKFLGIKYYKNRFQCLKDCL